MLDLQKASFGKRISAYLFDIILLFIAVVGIGFIVSAIVGYDGELDTLENMYQEYADKYGIDLEVTDEEYETWTDAEKADYEDRVNQANAEIEKDGDVADQYSKIITLTLLIVTTSTLLSYLVLEFAIPIFIGNGQTLGKKIFGVALMRTDGVKITTMQLFVRTILGKYTLETMIPVAIIAMMILGAIGIIGPIVLLGIIVLEAVCYFRAGAGTFIHDVVAVTVCVDYSSQMIFESEEALIEYKENLFEEAINSAKHTAEPLSPIYKRYEEKAASDDVDVTPSESHSSIVMESESYSSTVIEPTVEEQDTDLRIDLPDAELVFAPESTEADAVDAEPESEIADAEQAVPQEAEQGAEESRE